MNFSKYINIPYKYKGSDFSGCDCWGLVKLIMKEEKGVELPEFWYTEFWIKENKNHIVENIHNVNIIKIDKPFKPFDGVLFYNQGKKIVAHIGMIIDIDRFVHTYKQDASKVDRFGGYWNSRLYCGVRYNA